MPSPGVVVIVPVFNRVNLIIEALDSIAAQTRPPDKLIIVDDGSTDGTGDAIAAWISRLKPAFFATLIRQPNRGAPAARNRAIKLAADCPLIAFLDSDDLWPPDYLARMADAATARPRAIAFSCDQRELNAATGQQRDIPATPFNGTITQRIFLGEMPLPSCTIVRADFFRRSGWFNEKYRRGLEDVELFFRLSMLGPWASVPGEPVIRRIETRTTHGGPDQLSTQHIERPDGTLAALLLHTRFLFDLGGAAVIPKELWRHMEQAWLFEAEQARRQGDLAIAATCYRNAWRFDRSRTDWLFKSLKLRLRSIWRRGG